MAEIQDQYAEFAKRSQETMTTVVDAWTKSVQDVTAKLPSVTTPDGAAQLVDQIFDFTSTVIDVQRNLLKEFITTSAAVTEDVQKNLTRTSA